MNIVLEIYNEPGFSRTVIVGAIALTVWGLLRRLTRKSSLDNIPGPPSSSFIAGNLQQFFDKHESWSFQEEVNKKYESVVKLTGFFGSPVLYVLDPKALHQIVVKEQDMCDVSEFQLDTIQLSFGPGLLGVKGEQHRKQRKMLNPIFSAAHMRNMTPLFYSIARDLRNGIIKQVKESPGTDIDILTWFSRTALELIGQGGLGYSLDSLSSHAATPYGMAMKGFVPALDPFAAAQFVLPYIRSLGTRRFRGWLFSLLPSPSAKRFKDIVDTMDTESRNIYTTKKSALEAGDDSVVQQVGEGKDIMSVLLRENMKALESDRLPEVEVLGQMSLLLFAATDTTTTALTTIIQMLAKHQDIQTKLREELLEVHQNYGEELPYDELSALPLLDAVVRETLRVFPPLGTLIRQARKDILLPLSKPITGRDGSQIEQVVVPSGAMVIVGIRGSNLSKETWGDDAEEWKPERWLSPLPQAIKDARIPGVYSNMMTFNGGGRSCIGFKFSQLEMKVILSVLLCSFRFSTSPTEKNVIWNHGVVRYPTIGISDMPQFPVLVETINEGL
ncbi:hypothetical protein QCA50_016144 [Cerrena zonata]|uniref:Cytochrome P450 n=1 Tax=Cerrena zonata TaxID=2478898 RepID=A0AAW0FMQ8_9APHY